MKTFVVVPLYNEKAHIASVLRGVASKGLPVIVVDDGSGDGSGKVVKGLRLKNLTLLTHKVNLGKGAAMKTGAEYAFSRDADAVIFMDSDGQHLATNLPGFVEKLAMGKFSVVLGSRNMGFGVPLVRYFGNKIASLVLAMLFGIYVSDPICGFRGVTKNGYRKIKWESKGYGVEVEMVARIGKNRIAYAEVPVETIYHDGVKGVTLLDAFGILGEVVKWRLTI